MHDSTGTDQDRNDQDLTMDAAAAAAIMAEASDRARRTLEPDHHVFYTVRGAIWILGYGAVWLTVRGQHPFRGPNPGAYAAVVLITAVAAVVTVGQIQSETGLRGLSVLCLVVPTSCRCWPAKRRRARDGLGGGRARGRPGVPAGGRRSGRRRERETADDRRTSTRSSTPPPGCASW